MKKVFSLILSLAIIMSVMTACSNNQTDDEVQLHFTDIVLSDDGVTVGGTSASTDTGADVYISNDIVFYLEGQGGEYGEGEADEQHSQSEADKHTVVNITQPGNYTISGKLSNGQIAVDLGDDAKSDPDAVVTIVLNNVDLTCTVAPAIICYSAYECGDNDTDMATKDVNTETAGFNIDIVDGSINSISGSHVARIYKPGTTDKLHKYDAAIESLVSLNINGDDGVLNLISDNEGIETKLHMTINGGELNIKSADDALNAGEDYVSVITINDGKILADSNNGTEGDGIDSNGWLVINGGYVSAFGNSDSRDSGLDSDMGIHINGGTVLATGNMYDEISSESTQNFAVFSFTQPVSSQQFIVLKSSRGAAVTALNSTAGGSVIVYSSPLLTEDDYTLYTADSVTGESVNGIYANVADITGETQLAHSSMGGNMGGRPVMGGGNMARPDGEKGDFGKGQRPQMSDDRIPQNGRIPDRGQIPDDMKDFTPSQSFDGKQPQAMPTPDGEMPQGDAATDENGNPIGFGGEGEFDFTNIPQGGFNMDGSAAETVFTINKGANMFNGITIYTSEV